MNLVNPRLFGNESLLSCNACVAGSDHPRDYHMSLGAIVDLNECSPLRLPKSTSATHSLNTLPQLAPSASRTLRLFTSCLWTTMVNNAWRGRFQMLRAATEWYNTIQQARCGNRGESVGLKLFKAMCRAVMRD